MANREERARRRERALMEHVLTAGPCADCRCDVLYGRATDAKAVPVLCPACAWKSAAITALSVALRLTFAAGRLDEAIRLLPGSEPRESIAAVLHDLRELSCLLAE